MLGGCVFGDFHQTLVEDSCHDMIFQLLNCLTALCSTMSEPDRCVHANPRYNHPGPQHVCQPMSSHCDDSTPSCSTDSTGGSSTSCGGSPAVEELVELFECLSPSCSGLTVDGRASLSVLPPPRLPSLHTQQRIPVQYRRYSSSTPYCDEEDSDSSGSVEMEATARAIRALAPQRRRPYQTTSRSANLLTTPTIGSPKPQVRAVFL